MSQLQKPTKPRMRAVLDRIDGGQVLHIGCAGHDDYKEPSPNWFHQHLETVADDLTGVDVDDEAVRTLNGRGYDVVYDDAQRLENVTGPFDFVVATEVVEHLPNPGKMFEAVRNVLASDGRLLLTTPNQWALVYLRRVLQGNDPVGNEEHTCWLDATTLRELGSRCGFEGSVQYLQPMSGGLSSIAYRTGNERIGGTRLFADLEVNDE